MGVKLKGKSLIKNVFALMKIGNVILDIKEMIMVFA